MLLRINLPTVRSSRRLGSQGWSASTKYVGSILGSSPGRGRVTQSFVALVHWTARSLYSFESQVPGNIISQLLHSWYATEGAHHDSDTEPEFGEHSRLINAWSLEINRTLMNNCSYRSMLCFNSSSYARVLCLEHSSLSECNETCDGSDEIAHVAKLLRSSSGRCGGRSPSLVFLPCPRQPSPLT